MSSQHSFEQAVSVFHFTSKVSTAKIRKYKLATAKGMGPTRSGTKAPTPALPSAQTTRSNSNASQEPPAKKPRLKLNLRKPSYNDGDTIAVSRPKRTSAGKSRYSEEAVLSDDDAEEITVKRSPAASSGLSSPLSAPPSVKDEVVATDARVGGRDSYGDFMSYYIADGDDAEEETVPKPKREYKKRKQAVQEKQQRKPRAKKIPTPPVFKAIDDRPLVASQPSQLPLSRPNSRQSTVPKIMAAPRPVAIHPQAHPNARPMPMPRPPPMRAPMPPSRPIFEPPVLEEITVKCHASVPEKVKKLQTLSAALTNFGGVPNSGKTPMPPQENKKTEAKKVAKPEAPVDNFLAMFDDEDSDDKEESEPEIEPEAEKPRYLEHTGEPDGPLTYGIQFIMNALKSWAQQRLSQQQSAAAQQARMPPPKGSNGGNPVSTSNGAPPGIPVIPSKLNLSETPEGQAIAAFRDVVESGCLQVNVVMPADLASAVRHLYVQIDQLINQGSKPPPEQWQSMSYSAQIQAHQIRLDHHRDQQVRAQQAMGQPGLYPMYNTMVPPSMPGGHSHHMQFSNNALGDRRRSTPHVPGQPHSIHPSRVSLPAGFAGSSSSPMNGGLAGSPPMTANYRLPRSGQTMNFSFAPENMAAIQAFGSGAFPAVNQSHGPNMPNRGPMSASPVVNSSSVPPATQARPTSRGSYDKASNAKAANDVVETGGVDAHAHTARTQRQSTGFTAVNAPAKATHDTRATASSARPRSPGLSKSDAVVLEDD